MSSFFSFSFSNLKWIENGLKFSDVDDINKGKLEIFNVMALDLVTYFTYSIYKLQSYGKIHQHLQDRTTCICVIVC